MFDFSMTRVQYAGLSIDAFVEMCRSPMCGVYVCVCMRKKKKVSSSNSRPPPHTITEEDTQLF
jgi:hypothetical protein